MSTRSQLTKDLNESVKSLLGKHVKILLKAVVRLETKPEKTENRVLVFSPLRVFLLTSKVPTRIDCHFHYLEIQAVESRRGNHLGITVGDKIYTFLCGDDPGVNQEVDSMLTTLATAIRNIFPTVPLKYIVRKIDVVPITRVQHLLENDARPSGPCGGFSTQYACMCDYHGVPYREEVAWDVDTIYLSQDTRELNLRDFDHLDQKDLVPIISALEYNTYFTSLKASHTRLSHEALDRIIHVLRRSLGLEQIILDSLGVRSDFVHKIAVAVISNSNSPLQTIDLSHNLIEDKGALHLSGPVAKVSKGLVKLNLSQCGITSRGVNHLAHSLSLNKTMQSSLTHLDLSGNNLKDDIISLCNFLAQPNALAHLDISSTDITLESLFGALLRGCATNLTHLNVSRNLFSTKKGREVPPSFKQFFTSTLCLKHLNVAHCKLPLEALKHLLLGLACNESTTDLHLDLSCNSLGSQGAHVLESCIHGVRCISSLDISENNMDVELAPVITAIGKNKSIKSLFMGRSMGGLKPKHIAIIMDALVSLLQQDDCSLQHLHIPDSKLKADLHNLINAFGSNQCLMTIDISGNYMGDAGARLLAKALQINSRLRTIIYDRNGITLQGYSDLAYSLENNYSVRYMPFPLHDIAPCVKSAPERTDTIMRRIQELLHRNVSPKKYANGQAFRLQQSFILSSTQQMVDRLVSQTQEGLQALSNQSEPVSLDLSLASGLLGDAEGSKQILPKLHDIVIHRDEQNAIEVKLKHVSDEIHQVVSAFLEGSLESMVRCAIESSPHVLSSTSMHQDLVQSGRDRARISQEFIRTVIQEQAGAEIMNRVNEVNLTMAAHISDRTTDEVIEALSRVQRALAHPSSPDSCPLARPSTPDVVKLRAQNPLESHRHRVEFTDASPTKLEYLNLATPHLTTKRKSLHGRKLRPNSVVDSVGELAGYGEVPDLLTLRNSQPQRSEEGLDSVSELPNASQQLQHLVKGRPRRTKTRAPTRPLLLESGAEIGEGLDSFFRPGSVTPSSATPLASPTSEECSSLSLVDSLRDDRDNACTSGETTPVLDNRKFGRNSPLNKGVCGLLEPTPRSRSIDNLEKYSPLVGRRSQGDSPLTASPLARRETDGLLLNERKQSEEDRFPNRLRPSPDGPPDTGRSPILRAHRDNSSSTESVTRTTNGGVWQRVGIASKPRPWSVGGDRQSSEYPIGDQLSPSTPHSHDSSNDMLDEGLSKHMVGIGAAPGGSIVGISPGTALGTIGSTLGGGSIVGITPGAALERRSVRDMAAGLNRVDNSKEVSSRPIENIPRRQIAGKIITAHFEETLVEALQHRNRTSIRHSILRDVGDSVDV